MLCAPNGRVCKRRCRDGSTKEKSIESPQRQETFQQQQALYARYGKVLQPCM